MGLLDRLRPGRVATIAPDPTEPTTEYLPEPEAPAPSRWAPITAEDLNATPDWASLPPTPSVIPPMPVVLSEVGFERSLATRQGPDLFIGSLGHSVTDTAPSGLVEMVTVLAPLQAEEPLVEPAFPVADDLPLAPPPGTSARPGESQETVRRLPIPGQYLRGQGGDGSGPAYEQSAAEVAPSLPLVQSAEPRVEPAQADTGSATYEPSISAGALPDVAATAEVPRAAGLVGDQPPLVAPAPVLEPFDPRPSPLLHARPPADLPLVQLPTEPLPVSMREVPAPALAEETGTGPLVGERALVEPPAVAPDGAFEPADLAPSGPDMPLAPTAGTAGPTADQSTVRTAPLPPGFGGPPADTDADAGADAAPVWGDEGVGAVVPSPEAGPAEFAPPAVEAPAAQTAPLVGEAAPLIESAAAAPAAEAPTGQVQSGGLPLAPPPAAAAQPEGRPQSQRVGRSGIGVPMESLPPTARPWNFSGLTQAEQQRASRALIQQMEQSRSPMQGQNIHADLPLAVPAAAPPATTVQTRTLPLGALAGRTVGLESFPVDPGQVPEDLAPWSGQQAPLLGDRTPLIPPLEDAGQSGADGPGGGTTEGMRTRAEVATRFGLDLSEIPVDRGPGGAAAARDMRARAFTNDRGIVIPRSAGDLDSGPGAALFAHELTHVAQRARSLSPVPDEATPAGRLLEAEAVGTEMAFGAPNAGMALARTPMASPEPQIGATRPLFPPAEGFPLAAPSPATTIDTDTLAATILEKLTVSSPALQTLGTTETFTSPWAAGPASGAAPAMAGGPVQMAGETTQTTAPPPATSGPPDQIEGSTMAKPSDTDLSNLSRWLYPLIKYRLKGELREDRERAGHLTDHYRKW